MIIISLLLVLWAFEMRKGVNNNLKTYIQVEKKLLEQNYDIKTIKTWLEYIN